MNIDNLIPSKEMKDFSHVVLDWIDAAVITVDYDDTVEDIRTEYGLEENIKLKRPFYSETLDSCLKRHREKIKVFMEENGVSSDSK
ncbi:MAG: hypothetical protein R3Y47_01105 [Lachnospiraceae bacterium]